MISSPPQVPSGTLRGASSIPNYLHIITTSLSVYDSVILHPNPSSLSATFLLWYPSVPPSCCISLLLIPFPAMTWLPACGQWTSLCLLFQFICPFSLLAPSALVPSDSCSILYEASMTYLCSSHASPLAKMLLSFPDSISDINCESLSGSL